MNWLNNTKIRVKSFLTDQNRLDYLFFISAIGLLASLILSATAWSTIRTYPFSPIIANFSLSSEFQNTLYLVLILTITAGLLFNRQRKNLIGIGLLSLFILVLLDITRLQPWILHYAAVLLLFSFIVPRRYVSTTYLLDAARLIVGGIYFWAGIQKLNLRFFAEIFPWFSEPLWSHFGYAGVEIALTAGLLVPFVEAGFALGFFSRKLRKFALTGSTIMIVLVLSSLGPAGHSWNSSVWPWNFGIYGSALVLFLGANFTFLEFIKRQRKNLLGWLAISVFWIMPVGNFFGLTDHYLSWSLYSGKVPEATLVGEQLFLESLSPRAENGQLLFQRWTMTDLNMVPYPEKRVFINVFEKICIQNPSQPLTLKISDYSNLQSVEPEVTDFECN